MAKPKSIIQNGQLIHYSAGVIIVDDNNRILLIDRATPPFGWAGVAGHLDEGEEPEQAAIRETEEEVGLKLDKIELLADEFISWNWCGAGVTGHHWFLYKSQTSGSPTIAVDEVKRAQWYTVAQLQTLKLEPVWEYWFKKLELT